MHAKSKLSGMLPKGFKPEKCKTSLRMAASRIKLLRNKKQVQVRQMRRDVAQLLEAGQDQTARIRVEHVIREEKTMAAYELIALYCELIVARLSIIASQKNCPIDLKEAIASVIFASPRCADIPELMDVRKHFTAKYGKEFVGAALEVRPDCGVNRLVVEKLSAVAPDVEMKIKILSAIAEEHNVKWEPKSFEEKLQKQNDDLLYGSTTYSGPSMATMESCASSMSAAPPAHSGVGMTPMATSTSHTPPASANYSSTGIYGNKTTYSPANSNAFSHENISGPSGSEPPSSQYSAKASDTILREEDVSHHRERKSPGSSSNWNMDFKDATSAAQAAAESAEMASIAARAAAQLASRGNFSGQQPTGTYESSTYVHEDTPKKQSVEHLVKDERPSLNKQRSGINDPQVISGNGSRDAGTADTNRAGAQNMSTAQSPSPYYSSGSTSRAGVQNMPTARSPSPSYSSHSSAYDDLDEMEYEIKETEADTYSFHEERFSDVAVAGNNRKGEENKQASLDQENTKNNKFVSSHDTSTHSSNATWDDHKDTTIGDSPAAVFDQYDSDVEEHSSFARYRKENLLDSFSSQQIEEPSTFQEHNSFFSSTDWGQHPRGGSLVNDSKATLFSSTEQKPEKSEAFTKGSISPHSYDNGPPTFDSDGLSSDSEDEKTCTVHVKPVRPHSPLQERSSTIRSSRASGFTDQNKEVEVTHRNPASLLDDANENNEEHESISSKKFQNMSAFSVHSNQQPACSGEFRRNSGNSGTRRNFNPVLEDYTLAEEAAAKYKLSTASLENREAKQKQSLPFDSRTSLASDDNYESELGLNLGRLTPGLRNKPYQPPPYVKNSEMNVLPKRALDETPASTERSIHSNVSETVHEEIGDISMNAHTTKSSFGSNSNQELYDEKQGGKAYREARPRMTRNYFDSDDSEEELEHHRTVQTKGHRGIIQSRRTRDVTSQTRKGSLFRTVDQAGGPPTNGVESIPNETKSPSEAFSARKSDAVTPVRRENPRRAKLPAQQPLSKPVQTESGSSVTGEKSQKVDLSESHVSENVEIPNTPTLMGSQVTTESSAKGASHVHPKLPDYDSLAEYFQSLRANRR